LAALPADGTSDITNLALPSFWTAARFSCEHVFKDDTQLENKDVSKRGVVASFESTKSFIESMPNESNASNYHVELPQKIRCGDFFERTAPQRGT